MTRPRPMDPSLASQTPAVVSSLLAGCLSDKPLVAAREIERQGLWEYLAAESCDAGVGGQVLPQTRSLDLA
ncbi:MAG: hypothetical protein HY718_11290, partial [Planctomycetes bacterium]|nr:hypothetical protein [Planctomycetota bacterium]